MVRGSFVKGEVQTFHAGNGREFNDRFVAERGRLDSRVERGVPYDRNPAGSRKGYIGLLKKVFVAFLLRADCLTSFGTWQLTHG